MGCRSISSGLEEDGLTAGSKGAMIAPAFPITAAWTRSRRKNFLDFRGVENKGLQSWGYRVGDQETVRVVCSRVLGLGL